MAKKTETEVITDLRNKNDRRDESDRRTKVQPVEGERRADSRRKVQRRRQIDPTTCERDYTDSEVEFMQALDEYKRSSGRMFPTCSEILEVIRDLGYCQVTQDGEIKQPELSDSDNQAGGLGDDHGDDHSDDATLATADEFWS